ncbi:uncharacterized protein Osi18 [Anabrus simplex]|uniref:uncharacterized protein Osi18 n=1 Tax=Anabrus simplex TaxID=316456 RepID=UPI0035A38352
MEASNIPLIIEEPTVMEETRKDAPMIAQDPMAMEEPKREVVVTDDLAVEDQPMIADKSLTEQPMKEEETLTEMQMDEPLPVAEETTVAEDQVASARGFGDVTAADVLKKIYAECLQMGSFACVKPKVLEFLRSASKKDRIMLTRDLSIEKTGKYFPMGSDYQQQWSASSSDDAAAMFERIDDFLTSHELKVRVPKEIVSGELVSYVPKFLLQNVPTELHVPLTEAKSVERGFLKRIVMPFLLGLKFKATALIPLALALIALKTWKALTLGLLSIVLSGALVIFRLAERSKQRMPTYEVVHVPHHTSSYVEHSAPPSYDHHAYGRAFDAQPLAYRAYKPL